MSQTNPDLTAVGDRWLSETELVPLTGLSRRFWQRRRLDGSGPQFARLSSRCVRYRLSSVLAWLEARVEAERT